MIYNEFGDTDDDGAIPVEMFPPFYGCVWALIVLGIFGVLVLTCLLWAASAVIVR
jgi:hypothetical protein